MGILPIDRIRAWWTGMTTPGIRCAWCREDRLTFKSSGGYHYCSEACATADAEDQRASF
ncbi:hypothetical protein [Arthrobacter sp. StoSoilB22]|uniref:hypothetical protein n=1 Tax=Arthrobacter sp. StoSoilB22 TaxID=2830996 RepID=UPI001CC37140|nr:hypothetical protein [Arthrobacter sp. StoSoilB22]